jgi:tetratricopeptide (TPR) repeat protein
MNRLVVIGALLAALSLAACATSPFNRHFEAGRFAEAQQIFEQDSALQRQEETLFRAALLHAIPESPVYQPEKARQLFDRLLTLYPKSSYRRNVGYLTSFLDEVDRLGRDGTLLGQQIESLNIRIMELHERNLWLEELREKLELQLDIFGGLAVNLEKELRETRAQLTTLREELDRLKEIDLRTRRPPG